MGGYKLQGGIEKTTKSDGVFALATSWAGGGVDQEGGEGVTNVKGASEKQQEVMECLLRRPFCAPKDTPGHPRGIPNDRAAQQRGPNTTQNGPQVVPQWSRRGFLGPKISHDRPNWLQTGCQTQYYRPKRTTFRSRGLVFVPFLLFSSLLFSSLPFTNFLSC